VQESDTQQEEMKTAFILFSRFFLTSCTRLSSLVLDKTGTEINWTGAS